LDKITGAVGHRVRVFDAETIYNKEIPYHSTDIKQLEYIEMMKIRVQIVPPTNGNSNIKSAYFFSTDFLLISGQSETDIPSHYKQNFNFQDLFYIGRETLSSFKIKFKQIKKVGKRRQW